MGEKVSSLLILGFPSLFCTSELVRKKTSVFPSSLPYKNRD